MATRTLLIVDDSPSIRAILRTTLKGAGYAVVEAVDGVDALGKTTGVDAVLCDINMPRLNGLEFLRRLRAASGTRTLPLVFLTTESRPEQKEQGRLLGATAWITKPFNPTTVVEVMRRVSPADAAAAAPARASASAT